ncbi:CPBP family intramembrane metalloprotease [Candidatus Uhrbacteria bacterium]|nr:CPBP family intramembrane metalloprotease [Candidatus Uhrbacteria bacterium]
MVERFGVLGSQALILGIIYVIGLCARKAHGEWIIPKELSAPNNQAALIAWLKARPVRSVLFAMPWTLCFGPATEELLFRAPLIACFGHMTSMAWTVLVTTSIAFGLFHTFDEFVPLTLACASDSGDSAPARGQIVAMRIFRGVATTGLAILAGYYGITRQSLFMSFGIHAAWNAAIPIVQIIVLPFVVISVIVTVRLITYPFHALGEWRFRRRMRRYSRAAARWFVH